MNEQKMDIDYRVMKEASRFKDDYITQLERELQSF